MKPIPPCGPCRRRIDGELQEAPFCVVGTDPDGRGGGVLHWAWSIEEASEAAAAYREHRFQGVKVMNALTQRTEDYVHHLIMNLVEKEERDRPEET